MIDNSIRDKVKVNASLAQDYLYSSPTSGLTLWRLAEKYKLQENYKVFAITIGDIILGFYKIEDTVPLLQQELGIDPKTAALLGAEVLEFLAPLNDPNWQPPREEEGQEETNEMTVPSVTVPARPINITSVPPVAVPTPSVQSVPNVAPVVQTTPTVPPVATSAPTPAYAVPYEPAYQPSPEVPEPTYQSSQNDIRPGRGPLGEVPTYVPPVAPVAPPTPPAADRPRWSTDV